MVSVKKRRKRSKLRGSRSAGWGFRQKHRGSGHRGGVGMAGSGKRADHKRQKARNIATASSGGMPYFGKRGFTSRSTERKKFDVMNLSEIARKYGNSGEIKLEGYKILGDGEGFKAVINAKSATKSAAKKMEDAGGKINVSEKFLEKKEVKAESKAEEKKPAVAAAAVKKEAKPAKQAVVKA